MLFLLEPTSGEPVSDGRENEDARYFSLEELEREDVTDLSAYLGRLAFRGDLKVMTLSEDVDWAAAGRDTAAWKLFR